MYVYKPTSPDELDEYAKTLYSDEDAVQERCTAKATMYTACMLSGLVAKTVKNFTCDQDHSKYISWDIFRDDMFVGKRTGEMPSINASNLAQVVDFRDYTDTLFDEDEQDQAIVDPMVGIQIHNETERDIFVRGSENVHNLANSERQVFHDILARGRRVVAQDENEVTLAEETIEQERTALPTLCLIAYNNCFSLNTIGLPNSAIPSGTYQVDWRDDTDRSS